LEISFETKSLRMICEHEEEAIEVYGRDLASKLKARLSDLLALKTVADIFVGSPGEITYKSKLCFKIDLIDDYLLFFTSNHIRARTLTTGSTDWNNVSSIKIVAIDKNDE
jgi:hypothetical protein